MKIIELVIDRFLAVGEADWRTESPVSRDTLPFETEMDAMMTIPEDQRWFSPRSPATIDGMVPPAQSGYA